MMFGADLRDEAVLGASRPGPDLLKRVQIVALHPALGFAGAKHEAGNRTEYESARHVRAACSSIDQAFRRSDWLYVCRNPGVYQERRQAAASIDPKLLLVFRTSFVRPKRLKIADGPQPRIAVDLL